MQGDYYAAAPTVKKASGAEVEEQQNSERKALSAASTDTTARRSMNWQKTEQIALSKFLKARNIHRSNVITEAKLSYQFDGSDPVSNVQPIFDAYIKETEHETFIEMRPERMMNPMYRDRLYVMLSKIHHYRVTKQIEAHLDIVVVKVPGEEARGLWGNPDRIFQYFEPAIATGLLKVQEVELTEEEANECREQ